MSLASPNPRAAFFQTLALADAWRRAQERLAERGLGVPLWSQADAYLGAMEAYLTAAGLRVDFEYQGGGEYVLYVKTPARDGVVGGMRRVILVQSLNHMQDEQVLDILSDIETPLTGRL